MIHHTPYKKRFVIPIGKMTPEEARERISKLLKSYDPNYWLMKDRKQKMDKILKNDNTDIKKSR